MFINVTATVFILYTYPALSEILYGISCYLPTGKPTIFTHTKFDFKYLIFL